MFSHVAALIVSFGFYHCARFYTGRGSFVITLIATISNTLFGLVVVLIFLYVKLSTNDSFDTSLFSLRRSVRSKESFNLVTGGYKPKRTFIPKDDGGIYMGDEDDSNSINSFEVEEYDVSDYNMTFVTTRSVDIDL